MAKYYYEHNGELQEVELPSKKLDTFKASNPNLTVLRANDLDPAAIAEIHTRERTKEVKNIRRQKYANGDYIDALMKQMNYDRLNGKELVQDADDALGHWLNVKADHPMPNENG